MLGPDETTPLNYRAPDHWTILKQSIQEYLASKLNLHLIVLSCFLLCYGFFLLSYSLTLYLTEELDLSDSAAGIIYAVTGLMLVIYSLVFGVLPDRYGYPVCLLACGLVLCGGFLTLGLFKSLWVTLTNLFVLVPLGAGIALPSIKVGVKYLATRETTAVSYSVLTIFIYTAGAFAGLTIELARDYTSNSFQVEFFVASGLGLGLSVIGAVLMKTEELSQTQEKSYFSSIKEVGSEKKFWRYFGLVLVLVVVKSVFRHLDATLPKYMTREIGENAMFGMVLAIHSVALVVFIVVFVSYSFFYEYYSVMVVGSVVVGISPLALLFEASYLTCIVFAVGVALGESLWAPRLLDYTLDVAPQSKEGVYMSLATLPLFLAMVVSGLMSGVLLEEFCPKEGTRDCGYMWAIIAGCAMTGALLLLVLRKTLEEKILK